MQRVYTNDVAFVLVKSDRTVDAWGNSENGGDTTDGYSNVEMQTKGLIYLCPSGVQEIVSNICRVMPKMDLGG